MPNLPLVLVHGYSDQGRSVHLRKQHLVAAGFPASLIHIVTYRSLTNEVTIKDIAEGFDRALRLRAGLNQDQEFDVIVHSTGMLVVRAWQPKGSEREPKGTGRCLLIFATCSDAAASMRWARPEPATHMAPAAGASAHDW